MPHLLRARKRARRIRGRGTSQDAGNGGLWGDAAQLRLLQRGELPRRFRHEVPHLPIAQTRGGQGVSVAGSARWSIVHFSNGPGLDHLGGEDPFQDGC